MHNTSHRPINTLEVIQIIALLQTSYSNNLKVAAFFLSFFIFLNERCLEQLQANLHLKSTANGSTFLQTSTTRLLFQFWVTNKKILLMLKSNAASHLKQGLNCLQHTRDLKKWGPCYLWTHINSYSTHLYSAFVLFFFCLFFLP